MKLTAQRLFDIVNDEFDEEIGLLDYNITHEAGSSGYYSYTEILLYLRETGDVFIVNFSESVDSDYWFDNFLEDYEGKEFDMKRAKAISIVKYVTEL